jgi:hypothetical protein
LPMCGPTSASRSGRQRHGPRPRLPSGAASS